MPHYRDPIFKGCTRPAMFKGVPMRPFLAITGIFLLVGMWVFYLVSGFVTLLLLFFYVPLIIALRIITQRDDQRLRQMWMQARMRFRMASSRQRWGAISYSPLKYKKRRL